MRSEAKGYGPFEFRRLLLAIAELSANFIPDKDMP